MRSIIKVAVATLATLTILCSAVESAVIETDGRYNIVIAGQVIDGDSARLMKALGQISTVDDIHLTINSVGGSGSEMWTMIHMLERYTSDRKLHTYGYGNLYSAGACLFLMGDTRTLSSTASIMLHFGAYYDSETNQRITRDSERGKTIPKELWDRQERVNAMVWELVKSKTTLPKSFMEKSIFLSSEQALKYGVCTKINDLEGGKYVKEISRSSSSNTNANRNSPER
jgi:ATP-dependent protease ClpP protease subunit